MKGVFIYDFFDCLIGFLVVVLVLSFLFLFLIVFSLLLFFIQSKCGCFEDFVKKEDLKHCCFEKKGGAIYER